MIRLSFFVFLAAAFTLALQAEELNKPVANWPGSDPKINPGTNFFQFANGEWLKENPIPADLSGFSNATMLKTNVVAKLKTLLEEAATDTGEVPYDERDKVGAYYASYMDQSRIELLGIAPLRHSLDEVNRASSHFDLARLMGHANESFHGTLFELSIEADSHQSNRNAIYLAQGGLGSLDRNIYLAPEAGQLREDYRHYIEQLLSLIGWKNPKAMADAIVEYEISVATSSWTAADERDESKIYTPLSVPQLSKQAPGFPWRAYLDAAKLSSGNRIIVVDFTPIRDLAHIFAHTRVDVLKAWAAFHLADNAAQFLSREFVTAWFDLHGRRLQNVPEPPPRWRQAVAQVSGGGSKDRNQSRGAMGDAVGRLYADRWFDLRSRDTLSVLIDDLKSALRNKIATSDWMSPEARKEATKKLDAYKIEIGVPDHMDEYTKLLIRRDDLFGNVERAMADSWKQDLERLHHAPDRARWAMTPQTVNAYNYAPYSVVVFTAALLQPPVFDSTLDSAVTYGGIGAIIGHELTHAFDDVGRKFDASGHLRDWWTADDNANFSTKAARLVSLFSECEAAPGLYVDGKLTLGENIADIGGLQLAYAAYHASLHGNPAQLVDGLTGDQRFFLGFAKLRRGHRRPQALRNDISADPHTPDECRVNEDVRNLDGWYDAFGVTPDSPLFLARELRTTIW